MLLDVVFLPLAYLLIAWRRGKLRASMRKPTPNCREVPSSPRAAPSSGRTLRSDSRADLPPARSATLRQTATTQVEQVSHHVASAQPEGGGNLIHAAVGARAQIVPDPTLSFGQLIQRAGGSNLIPFALVLGAKLETRGGIVLEDVRSLGECLR